MVSQLLVSSFFHHSTKLELIPAFPSCRERSRHFVFFCNFRKSRATQMQRNEKAGPRVQVLAKTPPLQQKPIRAASTKSGDGLQGLKGISQSSNGIKMARTQKEPETKDLLSASRVCFSLHYPSLLFWLSPLGRFGISEGGHSGDQLRSN